MHPTCAEDSSRHKPNLCQNSGFAWDQVATHYVPSARAEAALENFVNGGRPLGLRLDLDLDKACLSSEKNCSPGSWHVLVDVFA